MPPKRRKYSTSTEGSRGDDDVGTPATKRRRPAIQYDPLEICQELFDTVRNHRTEDGKILCESFIRAPNKRTDPEYYNVVTTPMDMLKIQHKLRSEEYEEIEQLTNDIELLVDNTKAYYIEGTNEYNDACALWDLYNDTKNILLSEVFGEDVSAKNDSAATKEEKEDDASSVATTEEDDSQYEQLFCSIVLAKEGGREICEMFKLLPSKSTYPDYFQVIKNPIDLKMIATRVQANRYKSLDDMVKDLNLMVNNAKHFNEPGSVIYKDAQLLKKVILSKRTEVEAQRHSRGKSSERIRTRSRMPGGRSLSAVFASYEYESEGEDAESSQMEYEEEDDDEGDDKDVDDKDDDQSSSLIQSPQESIVANSPFWSFYKDIVNYTDDTGHTICEPFMRLPNKRVYPDYYTEILQPLSLLNVKKKLKYKQYRSLEQLSNDLELVFKNAMQYNTEESQLFKDAKLLKTTVLKRFAELAKPEDRAASLPPDPVTPVVMTTNHVAAVAASPSLPSAAKASSAPIKFKVNPEDHAASLPPDPVTPVVMTTNPVAAVAASPSLPSAAKASSGPIKFKVNAKNTPASGKGKRSGRSRTSNDKTRTSTVSSDDKTYLPLLSPPDHAFDNDSGTLDIVTGPIPLQHYLQELEGTEIAIRSTPRGRRTLDTSPPNTGRRRTMLPEDHLLKRLNLLYRLVTDYKDHDARPLITIFVQLPSKKEYPDYYQVISDPMDMTMIENKIKANKYHSEQAMVSDLELMFNNARHYNEENSQVYKDADTLERILKSKMKTLVPLDSPKRAVRRSGPKYKFATPLVQKLQDLYNCIKDFHDPRGRVLSTPFIKLPNRNEYPDYYEVIKRPIDMAKIQQKIAGQGHSPYETMEDMVADFVLMFDNACKYNEPDSLIYKDALTLQRICLEKKAELSLHDDKNNVPDVKQMVQQLMTNLFVATYNHADEDSRCYSDSFSDLPAIPSENTEANEEVNTKRRVPSFEQVKRNLDRGRYRRIDRFQEDMFEAFEYARKVSRSDSQLYEDAVELQLFFVKKRDELCKNGETMLTPALSVTSSFLSKEIEVERKEKIAKEVKEKEESAKENGTGEDGSAEKEDGSAKEDEEGKGKGENVITFKDQTYSIGDFVYVEPRRRRGRPPKHHEREKELEPHIVCIEKIWQGENEEQTFSGCWFYRPKETYHVATRKFLEKEVFKSDFHEPVSFNRIMGKCYVMSVKDYFKMKPEGLSEKDLFVCESRYSCRHRAFKKIKLWPAAKNDVKIIPRETLLVPVRVPSVFAEKGAESLSDDIPEGEPFYLDRKRETVEQEVETTDGNKYFEQLKTTAGWFKLGDHVYVRSNEDRPYTARIDKMWTDNGGNMYFHGPWYVNPQDVQHSPTRLFYRQEVFRSSIEDTNPMLSIQGRCCVLTPKEYCTSRPTEVLEQDIFICESKYNEAEKAIKKIPKATAVKKTAYSSSKVIDDEFFFFKKPITPGREPSPLLLKAAEEPYVETLEAPATPSAAILPGSPAPSTPSETPASEDAVSEKGDKIKKKKGSKPWQPSGYIVFSGEVRKSVQDANPDLCFGDISKLVGQQWRDLEEPLKSNFEEKAKRMAAEHAAKQEAAEKALNDSLSNYPRSQSPASPAPAKPPGYSGPGFPVTSRAYSISSTSTFVSSAAGHSTSVTSGMVPYHHHHLTGGYPPPGYPGHPGVPLGPRPLPPGQPGHPYYSPNMSGPTPFNRGSSASQPTVPQRPASPVFVSVPPRTQRLVHSEAYLRYIEGLDKDSAHVSNWDKTLTATQENTPLERNARLPTHWLSQGAGHHGDTVSALWALRDLMLKDSLTVCRSLDISEM